MNGIDDTAYPQFKSEFSEQELIATFTPSPAENDFIAQMSRRAITQALIAVQLKLLQRSGYCIVLDKVPAVLFNTRRGKRELRSSLSRMKPFHTVISNAHLLFDEAVMTLTSWSTHSIKLGIPALA